MSKYIIILLGGYLLYTSGRMSSADFEDFWWMIPNFVGWMLIFYIVNRGCNEKEKG